MKSFNLYLHEFYSNVQFAQMKIATIICIRKVIYIILFFIGGISVTFSQTSFQQVYGGTGSEWGYSIQQTSDGGYIIGGNTSGFGTAPGVYNDVYLLKVTSAGTLQWTKTYGSSLGEEFGNCVRQTTDGGYIITG